MITRFSLRSTPDQRGDTLSPRINIFVIMIPLESQVSRQPVSRVPLQCYSNNRVRTQCLRLRRTYSMSLGASPPSRSPSSLRRGNGVHTSCFAHERHKSYELPISHSQPQGTSPECRAVPRGTYRIRAVGSHAAMLQREEMFDV